MRIHIGSDHAGLEFKGVIVKHLQASGHEVIDHGPLEYDALDDYPVFCIPAAQGVARPECAAAIRSRASGARVAPRDCHSRLVGFLQ